jgi:hypothetical protein
VRARFGLAALPALGLAALGAFPSAHATVMDTTLNAPLSATPTAIIFSDTATYDFTAASTGNGPGAAVATSGTAQVSSLAGTVTDFFVGSSIDQTGELYGFSNSPTASTIPNSAADDYVGLAFTLSDGIHFGYAEVTGATLVSYGYESAPNTSIQAGATGGSPNVVPEPGSVELLIVSLTVFMATATSIRRR